MAYTRSWNELTPTDGDLRSQVDDFFRNLKVDIRQRMNDALVNDWAADPVVPKSSVSGAVNGKFFHLGGSAFNGFIASTFGVISYDNGAVRLNRANNNIDVVVWAPLDLPHGAVITGMGFVTDNNSGATVSLSITRRSWSSSFGTLDVRSTLSSAVPGVTESTSIGNHTVDPTYNYSLRLTFDNDGDFNIDVSVYGVRVIYNTPNAQSVR